MRFPTPILSKGTLHLQNRKAQIPQPNTDMSPAIPNPQSFYHPVFQARLYTIQLAFQLVRFSSFFCLETHSEITAAELESKLTTSVTQFLNPDDHCTTSITHLLGTNTRCTGYVTRFLNSNARCRTSVTYFQLFLVSQAVLLQIQKEFCLNFARILETPDPVLRTFSYCPTQQCSD